MMGDSMPAWVDRLTSDELIKVVFDHLRNVAICGAVCAAAIWLSRRSGQLGMEQDVLGQIYYKLLSVGALTTALVTYVLNLCHGIRRMLVSAPTRIIGWIASVFMGLMNAALLGFAVFR